MEPTVEVTDQTNPETGDAERVLVTRASGFVSSHVIKQLLEDGYKVRGTVSGPEFHQHATILKGLVPNAKYPLELVQTDSSDQDLGLLEAVGDCTYVMHVICPQPNADPSSVDVNLTSMIQNVLQVLRACRSSSTVKRLILTSSTAAIQYGHDKNKDIFTEADWSDILHPDCEIPYRRGIVMAEKSAWTYLGTVPKTFDVVALNPGFTLGPILVGRTGTNLELFRTMLHGDMKLVPRMSIGIVDVRDVARAHVLALKAPDADRHRHILVHSTESLLKMASLLAAEFNPYGYKVPTSQAPDMFVKVWGRFDKNLQVFTTNLGKAPRFDTTRMQQVLNLTTRATEETLIDMVNSMISRGMVKRAQGYPYRQLYTEPVSLRNMVV